MPPGGGSADQLRQRATTLRSTASTIESTSAPDLYRRAGDDVWRGPTPTRCLDDLLQMRTSLRRAVDDLRAAARLLEQHAAAIDAQAILAAASEAQG